MKNNHESLYSISERQLSVDVMRNDRDYMNKD